MRKNTRKSSRTATSSLGPALGMTSGVPAPRFWSRIARSSGCGEWLWSLNEGDVWVFGRSVVEDGWGLSMKGEWLGPWKECCGAIVAGSQDGLLWCDSGWMVEVSSVKFNLIAVLARTQKLKPPVEKSDS